jgi:predicted nucleic acid-binding Zn ribbon protein
MPIYEYICPDCKTKFELIRPYQQVRRIGGMSEMQTPGRQGFIQFLLPFR